MNKILLKQAYVQMKIEKNWKKIEFYFLKLIFVFLVLYSVSKCVFKNTFTLKYKCLVFSYGCQQHRVPWDHFICDFNIKILFGKVMHFTYYGFAYGLRRRIDRTNKEIERLILMWIYSNWNFYILFIQLFLERFSRLTFS